MSENSSSSSSFEEEDSLISTTKGRYCIQINIPKSQAILIVVLALILALQVITAGVWWGKIRDFWGEADGPPKTVSNLLIGVWAFDIISSVLSINMIACDSVKSRGVRHKLLVFCIIEIVPCILTFVIFGKTNTKKKCDDRWGIVLRGLPYWEIEKLELFNETFNASSNSYENFSNCRGPSITLFVSGCLFLAAFIVAWSYRGTIFVKTTKFQIELESSEPGDRITIDRGA